MRSICATLALAFALAGCQPAPMDGLRVGAEAPAFSLPAVGGGRVALADYAGVSPVVLFFHMAVG